MCSTITFESLEPLTLKVHGHPIHLEGILIKFVYEGHWVKVKVSGVKKGKNPNSCNAKLALAITPVSGSVEDRAVKFACSVGFSAM